MPPKSKKGISKLEESENEEVLKQQEPAVQSESEIEEEFQTEDNQEGDYEDDEYPDGYPEDEEDYEPKHQSNIGKFMLLLAGAFLFAGIALHYRSFVSQTTASCGAGFKRQLTYVDYFETLGKTFKNLKLPTFKKKSKSSIDESILKVATSKLPPIIFNISDVTVPVISAGNNLVEAIGKAVNAKVPVKITSINAIKSWKALKWNYWDLAKQLTYLDSVLSIQTELGNKVFYTTDDGFGSLFHYIHSKPANHFANLRFDKFLDGLVQPLISYLYSGNFEIVEELLHVSFFIK